MKRILFAATLAAGASGAAVAQAAPAASDEVVITGPPLSGPFATSVETVGRDDILKTGGASLADSLVAVPGVAGTGFAAGASRPVIRGMDANRVKVLEDGVGSADVSDIGPDHGVPIDPLSARRIEVVRGAGTLRYGSQAIGGVVNAVNDRVPLSLPSAPLKGEASFTYGSAADTREGAALLDGHAGRLAFHADAFKRKTGDYDTPLGALANSYFDGDGYALGSSYFFKNDNRLGAAYVRYDSRYGIPAEDTYIDMRQNKGLFGAAFNIKAGAARKLTFDASYGDYIHSEIDPATGDALSTFKNREYDGRMEVQLGPLGLLASSALGVQVQDRGFSARGEGADYLAPTKTQSGAAFLFTETPLGAKTNLQGAVRLERTTIDGVPASGRATTRRFAPLSASLGAVMDVTDALRLGLTFASAARAPAQTELFARGPHDGPQTFETGDPGLGIERSNSLEATIRYRKDRLDFDGALWGARFSDYIYGALTGALCDETGDCTNPPGGDLKPLFYSARDAEFQGAEAKAKYDLIENAAGALQFTALADLTRATFADGASVPRIQPWRAGGGLTWTGDAFDAGFLLLHIGKQDRVPAGDTITPGYESLSAQATWRPIPANHAFEIALVGRNLTDSIQRDAVALNRADVIAPGRDIRIVLRAAF
jgi:iron complex outermembrane receptor protein